MSGFVPSTGHTSWGRVSRPRQFVAAPAARADLPALLAARNFANGLLPRGLGRSYGDTNLNAEGGLIDGTRLGRIVSFDANTGLLEAEGGTSLAAILAFALPRGFFLPVTPGTRFATLAGAIANDVHGKNHHRAGSFGRWVEAIELLRSDGAVQRLTPADATGSFAATIGGLGLTGFVAAATIRLKRVASSLIDAETVPFGNLGEFFALSRDSESSHEYAVAWVDCLAKGSSLGRGLFTRADHAPDGGLEIRERRRFGVPVETPGLLLNRWTIGAMNGAYRALGRRQAGRRRVPFDSYFYPLDGIGDWNRLYGRRGLFQFQSVVPPDVAADAIAAMLGAIADAGEGSFLAVLKTFGPLPSPGLLSFPREGATLALDFPNKGASTLGLLSRLDAIVAEAGGRLYPAKDGRMPAGLFASGYLELERFKAHLDPAFSSSFWRRMTEGG